MAAGQEAQVTPRLTFRDRFLAWAVSWLGWFVLHAIGGTSRLKVYAAPGVKARWERGGPLIYAFWHRYQLLMCYQHRHRGVHVLVSRSRDGEFIARVLKRFGFFPVRGSSSRGGMAAFLELIGIIENGGRVAFTPDGPRGPLRAVQPGVLALAAKTGAPVVPIAWAGTGAWRFKSWDEFLAPQPFRRYAVVYGEPLAITEGEGETRLRAALIAMEAEAQRLLEDPSLPPAFGGGI